MDWSYLTDYVALSDTNRRYKSIQIVDMIVLEIISIVDGSSALIIKLLLIEASTKASCSLPMYVIVQAFGLTTSFYILLLLSLLIHLAPAFFFFFYYILLSYGPCLFLIVMLLFDWVFTPAASDWQKDEWLLSMSYRTWFQSCFMFDKMQLSSSFTGSFNKCNKCAHLAFLVNGNNFKIFIENIISHFHYKTDLWTIVGAAWNCFTYR